VPYASYYLVRVLSQPAQKMLSFVPGAPKPPCTHVMAPVHVCTRQTPPRSRSGGEGLEHTGAGEVSVDAAEVSDSRYLPGRRAQVARTGPYCRSATIGNET
jgi:hypothetical protein